MTQDDPASYHPEDATGPRWSDPWGCCFGECDTPFSVAFREYHGLAEAHQRWNRELIQAKKDYFRKVTRRSPRPRPCELTRMFFFPNLTMHQIPRRLRPKIFPSPAPEPRQ